MSNQLTTFAYLDNSVRVVEVDGQPWFVALDLCKALNVYLGTRSKAPNVTLLARDLLPDETALNQIKGCVDALGRKMTQMVLLVSESGFYKVVMRSDKPAARAFQDWVTRDVLPAIRKTYPLP